MIKNYLCYDLYDSDNGWGMGLGAKNQNDADVCTLAEILKEEDDDEDEESKEKEEEEEKEKMNNDNETKATDEILKKLSMNFQILNFSILLDFLLQCQFRSTHCRRIYSTLCTKLFLYLVEKFLANIFQKSFHYNTKSKSSRSKSSEEENTEDSTQDSK